MFQPDAEGVIARLAPSPVRRLFALAVVYLLGALLVWIAFSQPAALGWAILLAGMGALILIAAERMRRSTALHLALTTIGLSDTSGRVLARWEDIARVERGTFAFKPSHGFVLILTEAGPAAWAPGLYWKIGRRIGVGGVTPARQTRFLAEQIAFTLAARTEADEAE